VREKRDCRLEWRRLPPWGYLKHTKEPPEMVGVYKKILYEFSKL
jgi:hypothetical protein